MADHSEEHVSQLEQRLSADPSSPLFARLAGYYLQVGRAEEALRLCDTGLAHHPSYSTGHLIKGKILLSLQMPAEAKREFGIVRDILPANQTVINLYAGIDVPETVEPPATAVEETGMVTDSFVDGSVREEVETPVIAEAELQAEVVPTVEEPSPFGGEEMPQTGFAPVEEEQPSPFGGTEEQTTVAEEIQPAPEAVEPSPFGEATTEETVSAFGEVTPSVEPSSDQGFGEVVTQEPPAAEPPAPPVIPTYDEADPLSALRADSGEDAFGQSPPTVGEQQSAEAATPPTDYFDAFSQLQPVAQEPETAASLEGGTEQNPFEAFGGGTVDERSSASTGTGEEESFEEFSARTRMELFGTENTMTLEEFLGTSTSDSAPPATDQIGELAEKLKSPKKITPVINFSEKETRKASEAGTDAGTGFVTPTLAEIYAKQGWYDDAIKAYRTLAANKPAEREKYEQRIAELEELKSKQ